MDKLPDKIPTDKIISRIPSFSGTRISKVGLEIEGEFHQDSLDKLSRLYTLHGDGSVHDCDNYDVDDATKWHNKHGEVECYETRELNTEPQSPFSEGGIEYFNNLFDSLKAPSYHWNQSAGFHIHMSFIAASRIPEIIFDTEFIKAFSNQIKSQFPTEYRLRRDNDYCGDPCGHVKDDAELLEVMKCKRQAGTARNRYQAVNMISSWEDDGRKTIEFRIFPANSPEKMREYLNFTINFVNIWLGLDNERLFSSILDRADTPLSTQFSEKIPRRGKTILLNSSTDRQSLEYKTDGDPSVIKELMPSFSTNDDLMLAPSARSAITLARILTGRKVDDECVVICGSEEEFNEIPFE